MFDSIASSSSSGSASTSRAFVSAPSSLADNHPAAALHPSSHTVQSPRRAFSLPSRLKLSLPSPSAFYDNHKGLKDGNTSPGSLIGLGLGLGSPMLPLHSPTRSTARRLSYNLKSRASRHALTLTIGGLFTLAVFIFCSMSSSSEVSQFNSASKLQLYGRSRFSDEEHQHKVHLVPHRPDGERDNGVSLLEMGEEELIAEDDLFWDHYTDPEPLSKEEQTAEAEIQARKADVIQRDKVQSLRALVWWLTEGGIFPHNWQVPSKSYLRKVGGRGMERLLEEVDSGEEGDEIFSNGWAEFANKRYRVVVFSKSYCPYSKKAKSILGDYHISPAPFTIELDQRSDMDALQTLLQRITGRRTVPNVLLDFTSIGGSDDVTLLHSEGGLQRKFNDMEVLPFSRRRRPAPVPIVNEAEEEDQADEPKGAGVVAELKRDLGALTERSDETPVTSEDEPDTETARLDETPVTSGDEPDTGPEDEPEPQTPILSAELALSEDQIEFHPAEAETETDLDLPRAMENDETPGAVVQEEEDEEERAPRVLPPSRENTWFGVDDASNAQKLRRHRYAPGTGPLGDTVHDAWREGALFQ